MKITKIYIKNYKSIEEIHFELNDGLNVFIGENSTGKSNIFKALDWLLGKAYPTFNQIGRNDHFMGSYDNKIRITIDFDDGMQFCLNEDEQYKFRMLKNGLRVTANDIERRKYCCAYLDTNREINHYMPSNKWSLIGRILQEVNEKFTKEQVTIKGKTSLKTDVLKEWLGKVKNKLLFSVQDDTGENIMEKLATIIQHETSQQLNRKESEFDIDFNLYDPWNFYRTLQITVKEDNGLEFQAGSLGMGVQASISIAILKAYSELNLSNNSSIIIDEPELYLHPQAQRNFYNILQDVAKEVSGIKLGTQILYTTHSPNFLNLGSFHEVFIVRKCKMKGTYIQTGDINNFLVDLQARTGIKSSKEDFLLHTSVAYNETGDSQSANEAFFGKKVILVEGQSESLSLPYLFTLAGFDYIKHGITIVRCGGKSELDRFYRIYNEFGIPCYVIFDGDKQNEGTHDEKFTISKNKDLFNLLQKGITLDYPDNMVHDSYLGFEYTLEKNLGFTPTSGAKGLKLFQEIKQNIDDSNIPVWVLGVIDKINELDQSKVISVLENNSSTFESEKIPF